MSTRETLKGMSTCSVDMVQTEPPERADERDDLQDQV